MKAECRALQRKNTKALTVASESSKETPFPREYAPFISSGTVSLLGSSEEISVAILRDTGAAQLLIVEDALPFSADSARCCYKE